MRLINIIDSFDRINYGVWNAATVNASLLSEDGISVELWFPRTEQTSIKGVTLVSLPDVKLTTLQQLISQRALNVDTDIIITHGAWRFATRWGHSLKKKGFKWIYVPHGMLEPWSFQQKRFKKKLYFSVFEKRMAMQCDLIRAVAVTEKDNLQQLFKSSLVKFLPNGVHIEKDANYVKRPNLICRYLFLSRLHAKKNIKALIGAWIQSSLNNKNNFELVIAGPDQGELKEIEPLMKFSQNVNYVGSVYGTQKDQLMKDSHFYVLPSFSEGLPSSLLEAMAFGLIPIITEGCNLPEVFTMGLGVHIDTDETDICRALETTSTWDGNDLALKGKKCMDFIMNEFSLETVTTNQHKVFKQLLSNS